MKKLLYILLVGVLILVACGKNYEISDVINKFKSEGLSVKNLKTMRHEDFGMAPMKSEDAKIFTVQDDKKARIFKFKNKKDLEETKKYYDELGKSSAAFYSHVYAKDNMLIQMNGDIDDNVFNKYKTAMEKTLK
ncbi:hypothetical protein BUY49_08015 [Staphylococcus devriesei]|uniref:hypothetical protein n=1 Tax=Staphylococcus devriesei TaxID=586733 RepID=UPI000E684459|nr:hypothetical protein [Staphylococcus devriesei]RIL71024.1 hypothetical protein BUY49_08015 [Staphylococcus devriesei]